MSSWNLGAELIFGDAAPGILGQQADDLFTQSDRAEGLPPRERQTARLANRA